MSEEEIRVRTADGTMTAFIVHPDRPGPFPVAVVFMDGIGYREQVKANARRFSREGYYCVAPDLYYRSGDGVTVDMSRLSAEGPDGPTSQRLREVMAAVTPDRVTADIQAVLNAIAADPAAKPGPKVCVGYCLGARLALHVVAAFADEFVAVAAIHPGALVTDAADSPHHDLARVRAELYVAFAETDRTATPQSIDAFRDEMAGHGVRGTVERLPGTTHGFAMADLPVYNHDAAERHFARTLELWSRNLPALPVPA